MYQGTQDGTSHLGGFTAVDPQGLSPAVWRYMMVNLTVKSLIDVGCGKGISTSWFAAHGADVLCVEGSPDAVASSHLARDQIVEHDVSRGPWWPPRTYDAVWSVEFVEHVGRQHMHNYLPIFESAALIFVSHSVWGGYHHVEVHPDSWWRARFESVGLVYMEHLTKVIRRIAAEGKHEKSADGDVTYNAQHVWTQMQVFSNPAVMRLPPHRHVYGGKGCYGGKINEAFNRDCGEPGALGDGVSQSDRLPRQWKPHPRAFLSDEAVGWRPTRPATASTHEDLALRALQRSS